MKTSTINHFIAAAERFLSLQCKEADSCWNGLAMEILHCQQQHAMLHKDSTSKDPMCCPTCPWWSTGHQYPLQTGPQNHTKPLRFAFCLLLLLKAYH